MLDACGDGGEVGHSVFYDVEAVFPFAPFGIVIAFNPFFNCGQEAHDFFFARFHGTANRVVGRPVGKSGLQEVFATQNEAR